MELRPDDIQEILRIFSDSELEELRLEVGETRLHVSKRGGLPASEPIGSAARPTAPASPAPVASSPIPAGANAASAPPPQAGAGSDAAASPSPAASGSPATSSAAAGDAGAAGNLVELRSPLLGVFYRRPAPDRPTFVEIGSEVAAEDPVCIVDVMKMFTQVPAGVAGRIVEICVEDGQLVEHGQVLMRIEPRD